MGSKCEQWAARFGCFTARLGRYVQGQFFLGSASSNLLCVWKEIQGAMYHYYHYYYYYYYYYCYYYCCLTQLARFPQSVNSLRPSCSSAQVVLVLAHR